MKKLGMAIIAIMVFAGMVTVADGSPVAQDSAFTVAEGGSHSGAVSATLGDGDALTFALVSGPGYGTLTFNSDGSFSYTAHRQPTVGFIGTDSFAFHANDGLADSNVATVTVTITPVNDAPVATDGVFTVLEGGTHPGAVSATDVDGDAVTFALVSGPGYGTLTFNSDGSFSYTAHRQPTVGFIGTDSFTFRANDGLADSNVATVTVTIVPVNGAPVAHDSAFTVEEGETYSGAVSGSDVDGDAVTFVLVSGPGYGTVTFNVDGTFNYAAHYQPVDDFVETDSFTFRANDGLADSNVATVTVTITQRSVTRRPASPVSRFWSPVLGGHFFTISEAERAHITATWPDIWMYEGVAWQAYEDPAPESLPVYRFWSPVLNSHFYTISAGERDYIMSTWPDIWHSEGVAFYAYVTAGAGRSAVHRFWSPVSQSHFYTISEGERDYIMATWPDIWTYEGIAYYAYAASAGSSASSMAYDETNAALTAETTDAGDLAGLLLDTWQAEAVVEKPLVPVAAGVGSSVADTVVELDSDGVYFPLQYTDTYVAASVYDSELAAWKHVLTPSWEPDGVSVAGSATNRHWLAVLTYDAAAEVWGVTHGSWFGRLLEPEAGDPGVVLADDEPVEVGLPVEALLLPEESAEMLLLVYDVAEEAYIETIPGLKGGARYDWTVPQWNRWYRLDIVRELDGEVLQSQWVGHMRTH